MSRPTKLSDEILTKELTGGLPGWALEGAGADRVLAREFKFADFAAAMKFVNRLAETAEAVQHHPDIDIRYNKVRIALVTHDAGGITENDISMARKAGELA
jgi:4a-hydroxytetrahydrobiopterin dehydratase